MRKFAANTTVPIARSQQAIQTLLAKYGATGFVVATRAKRIVLGFELNGKAMRFDVLVSGDKNLPQEERRTWRALLLIIKAKLEASINGVATFEQEFMPYFVMKSGRTLSQELLPQLDEAINSGQILKLLPMGVES